MKKLLLFSPLSVALAWSAAAVVNVPLTIQEALYPGSIAGVSRTADPVTVGIPLPDDPIKGVTDVNQLGLTGASVGQFRVLGRWPSGRIKWVLVDTQASVGAGQLHTSYALTGSGAGSFGGSNLATDNGATITVNTGAAAFTIRKANFNLVDNVVMGTSTVVASGSSQGLVITGPAPGQTVCSPCTTIYSSANDATSTAVIEENGPAKTVIRATGNHVDSAGNIYMHFTVRMYFFKGKSFVKITSVLRNADYGTSNSYATAYKGFQGYELRVKANLSGTPTYKFGTHTASPATGQMSPGDDIYLYQGTSNLMKDPGWCGYLCVPYTTDTGYRISKNGAAVATGTASQYPQGWADISDASGVGVEIGHNLIAGYESESLEFAGGGSDVRIGTWAPQNSKPYYQPWPQWSIRDVYLNFHGAALSAPADEFLKYQHLLLARAPYTHYNSAAVFPYPLLDPTAEDAFYTNTVNGATPALSSSKGCCIQDLGLVDTYKYPLTIWRFYSWAAGSGANQSEFRWAHLLNFLTRGYTGRYIDSASFYRMQTGTTFPLSDGFDWRTRPHYKQSGAELDGYGNPNAQSANSALGFRDWHDQEHNHSYGMADFYFLSGDETVREGMVDGMKDYFLNPDTYQAGANGGVWNSRAVGVTLMGAARFSQFLAATGDSDAAAVLNQGITAYNLEVKPELCVSGYPAGCSMGTVDGGPWTNSRGVSRTRGLQYNGGESTNSWCGVTHNYRRVAPFMEAILVQGILELRNTVGAGWSEYWNSLDLAYGISRWATTEMFVDDGSGKWNVNGFRYKDAIDVPSTCKAAGETPESDYSVGAQQTVSGHFLARYLTEGDTSWATKFKINLQKDMDALGMTTSDFGTYHIAAVIDALNKPSTALGSVPISSVVPTGAGSYTISWTVPSGAQSYRIKWAPKTIVDWIGFDNLNNVFTGDPANTTAWFAANNATGIPAPGPAGSTQSITINTGVSGLTAANFSVKAFSAGAVNPDFTVSASNPSQSAAPGSSASFILNISGFNGFTGTVAFSASGLPSGATAAFNPAVIAGTASTTLTVSVGASVAAGSYPLIVTAASGSLTRTTSVTVNVAVADFTLTASPSAITAITGGSSTSTVTIAPSGSFSGSVTLTASGLPSGATATFTPATVSGAGTSSLKVTVPAAAASGSYPITVTAASGSISHTAAVSLNVTVAGSGGTLSGAMATPPAAVSLTANGGLDWAHWGYSSPTDYNHKSGSPKISAATLIGSAALNRYINNSTSFTWTDGTPTTTATASTTGVYVIGQNNGFSFTVPADTTPRVLNVYVGAWRAQGQFAAHLSDNSSPDYTDSTLNNTAGVTTLGVYTLTYAAGSANQTLTITYTMSSATSGNVTLQAATLAAASAGGSGGGNLVLVSGNNQSGIVSQTLANPFTVKASDAAGNPLSGVTVTFATALGGGTLSTASAITDSQGLASTTLTLGATPGDCVVSATAGSLAGSPVIFTATATPIPTTGSVSVTWSKQTTTGNPGENEWFIIPYDPVSQQTIAYATLSTSMSIYSTDVFFYSPANKAWTRFGGTGDLSNNCPANTAAQPGNRHPVGQMAIDTKRNFLWISGGVCGGVTRTDTYFMRLNVDPRQNTWQQVVTAHNPVETRFSSMVYDPDDDVLFSFGYDLGASTHDNWVFCRTAENPTPGVLTARQSAAGCAAPDDWTEVKVAGGTIVPGSSFPGLVYDTITKKVILFGGGNNQTWAYNVPTKTWVRKALSTTAPPVDTAAYWGMPAWAYDSATHRILYHQTGGTGAPADWEYDPAADTWGRIASAGSGTVFTGVMAYDASRNLLIGVAKNVNSYGMEIWHGALSTAAPVTPANACDINGDGTVNQVDFNAMIGKVLGLTACGAADLNGDGKCDIVDIQRIANAITGTCRTGQ
jgi:Bacterial Ig-like domain (group 1)/PcRGLX-like protein central beta sandwich domain/Dockerin type I domain